jgi:tRNA-dihydrouridine synthase
LDIVVVFLAKTQSAIALSVFCKIRISWDNFFADLLPKLAFLLLLFF